MILEQKRRRLSKQCKGVTQGLNETSWLLQCWIGASIQALALKYHPDKNPDCSECRALVRRELFWDVLDKVLGHPWAIFCLICLPWL